MFGGHLGDALLARYVDGGERPDALREREAGHLRACDRCGDRLAAHRKARRLLLVAEPVAALPLPPTYGRPTRGRLTRGRPGDIAVTRWIGLTAAVCLAVAVAAGAFGRFQTPGPAPATTAVAATSSARTAVPPTPVAGHAWSVLGPTDAARAFWSPDGRWFAAWGLRSTLALYRSDGGFVRDLPGDAIVWLDSTAFVVADSASPAARIGFVSSDTYVPFELRALKGAIGNGHGAIAVTNCCSGAAGSTFTVWTQDGKSPDIPGEAVAWSPDGTRLAVWHFRDSGRSMSAGTTEVRSWPGLHVIASVSEPTVPAHPARFDPSGRYLLFPSTGKVIDTATRTSSEIAGAPSVWDAAGRVVSGTGADSWTVADTTGEPVSTFAATGDSAESTADGRAILLFTLEQARSVSFVTVVRAGALARVDLPGPLAFGEPDLAPDGRHFVAVCRMPAGSTELILVSIE